MSSNVIRIIAAVIFLGHGIGHALGVWAALGNSLTDFQSSHSWLVDRLLGQRISSVLMFVLFLAALVGFVGAGLGLFDFLLSSDLWLDWAVWASILSIIALILYPKGFPTLFPNVIGALLVDVVVLILVRGQHWPSGLIE
jgi:hypothetical protein